MPKIDSIEHTIVIPAPIERVWDAITIPEQMVEWFGTRVEIDLRVGGMMVFGWDDDLNVGRIKSINKPTEFVYQWRSYVSDLETPIDDLPTTQVCFTLESVDEGTRLTMKETGFAALPPDIYERAFSGNASGWTSEMDDLMVYLTGQPLHE